MPELAIPTTVPTTTLGAESGTRAIVAGWGLTSSVSDVLRAVEVPLPGNAGCRRTYGPNFDPRTMICAGREDRDSCNGDSGGPQVGPDGRLIGLVSFGGTRCATPGEPGVYTRVSAEQAWIAGAEPVATPARVRFGRLVCGARTCRIELRVTGTPAAIAVTARGRTVAATRVTAVRWTVRLPLPDGRSTITAVPQGGRATKLLVEIG